MDLHYSQTCPEHSFHILGFTTLWIYTILKLSPAARSDCVCFTTLWIYTILKLTIKDLAIDISFTTLWIYTILKRVDCRF